MPESKGAMVSRRFQEMKNSRDDFEDRWQRNNRRKFAFMRQDGSTHLPLSYVLAKDVTEEIVNEFDGTVSFVPTVEGVDKNLRFQHEQLTKIYNQEITKIGAEEQRRMAIYDSVVYGIGIVQEMYQEIDDPDSFKGLITERVDPVDWFMDNNAVTFFDPRDISGAQDVIRRRRYSKEAFIKNFSRAPFNQALVKRVSKGGNATSRELLSDIKKDQIEQETEMIEVYEYWSREEQIITTSVDTEVVYAGVNPYKRIPFVVYAPNTEFDTLYPPSMLEVIAPILKQLDISVNMWGQLARMLGTPIIFADESTGLLPGTSIRGGIQTAELDGRSINEVIQQVTIGNDPAPVANFIGFLNDQLTIASGKDVNALLAKPQELATQTKQKITTELRRLRGNIRSMMQGAESQRAMLRARNIIKYIFNKKRDILVNDSTIDDDGRLIPLAGSKAVIEINNKDWESFEFFVLIKSKAEKDVKDEETRNQLRGIFSDLGAFFQQFPETQKEFQPQEFLKQLLDTFPELNTAELFKTSEAESNLKKTIESAKRGEVGEIPIKSKKEKMEFMGALSRQAEDTDDPVQQSGLIDALIKSNDADPQALAEEALEQATAAREEVSTAVPS